MPNDRDELPAVLRRARPPTTSNVPPEGSPATPPVADDEHWWLVEASGRAFRPPGGSVVDLERRPVLVRVLAALSQQRLTQPGLPIQRDALARHCWPGERLLAGSALNRLNFALVSLRKLGLRDLLKTVKDGYLLDLEAPLAVITHLDRG